MQHWLCADQLLKLMLNAWYVSVKTWWKNKKCDQKIFNGLNLISFKNYLGWSRLINMKFSNLLITATTQKYNVNLQHVLTLINFSFFWIQISMRDWKFLVATKLISFNSIKTKKLIPHNPHKKFMFKRNEFFKY